MTLSAAAMILAGVFAVSGLLSLGASVANADWFFKSQGVRMITGSLRRSYSRAIYAVLGAAFIAMAVRLIVYPVAL